MCLREASQNTPTPTEGGIEPQRGEVIRPRPKHCPQRDTQREERDKNVNPSLVFVAKPRARPDVSPSIAVCDSVN